MQAVLDLPPQQRAATYLVYWAGLTVAETADLIGIRPGTAKRYLHLARRTLKGVLDEH
jgi:RNA polymerase sigma-70 factor (ECF subfamily)